MYISTSPEIGWDEYLQTTGRTSADLQEQTKSIYSGSESVVTL